MQTFILFLKGLIIGLGKIIPGVSGSLIAISLGVYEEAMKKIETILKEKKESIKYLLPLGIGICLSVLFGSKIMLHFLNTYYLFTVSLFIGLIVGTVPSIAKKEPMKNKDWLIILGIVLFLFALDNRLKLPEFTPNDTFFSLGYIVFLGFIDALTTVLPGISGTATFMMLGSYTFVLTLFSNPFSNIFYCILFGIGLVAGIFLMIKVVNYCFSKYKHMTWVCIIGFLFSSILSLVLKIIDSINHTNVFPVMLLLVIGYFGIGMFSSE